MIVYIAGKMAGLPDLGRARFRAAADAVYLLGNWRFSAGANIELRFASYQGKHIFFEKDEAKEKET